MSIDNENVTPVVDRMAEVKAMGVLAETFASLQPESIGRVLRWAVDSWGVAAATPTGKKPVPVGTENGGGNGGTVVSSFNDIAELFAAASPTTEADKTLVASYWVQWVQGQADFSAFEVNAALTNMGERVKNITTAFDTLRARKPAPVIQFTKAGTSKQARKTYKVTTNGKAAVEAMIGQQHQG